MDETKVMLLMTRARGLVMEKASVGLPPFQSLPQPAGLVLRTRHAISVDMN